jgi:predicted nuclease of restriction endonuclease-like (RecB) superfamily
MGPADLPAAPAPRKLLGDIRDLIETARGQVARAVNTGLVSLYWSVGRRIRQDILKEKRAGYGQKIIQTLSVQLAPDYGQGFNHKNLWRMIQFAEVFPEERIVVSLGRQLTWTHFRLLIPVRDPLKRDFYAEMCRLEHWNVPTLRKKISDMLFERTALSRKPAALAARELKELREQDKLTPDLVFRDPVLLGFLGLKDTYQEKDLEAAILRELESFLVELGSDFAFVARQKRISVGSEDYYLDLLFFHRGMRRLVAIELKLGKFQAADKGQLELYLRWLDRHERRPGERSPLGLILCAESDAEHVELLQLEKSGIRVAQYMTELPARGLLESKLHQAIRLARQRLAAPPAAPHPPA